MSIDQEQMVSVPCDMARKIYLKGLVDVVSSDCAEDEVAGPGCSNFSFI